jgi:hypothetical protein
VTQVSTPASEEALMTKNIGSPKHRTDLRRRTGAR